MQQRLLVAILALSGPCAACEVQYATPDPSVATAPPPSEEYANASRHAVAAKKSPRPEPTAASAKQGDDANDDPPPQNEDRSQELVVTEIQQLESLLRVLRPSSADRPVVLQRLAGDYEELSRVGRTEAVRNQAAKKAEHFEGLLDPGSHDAPDQAGPD